MDKKKSDKRMGQGESLEKVYQPQIIRDRDNREREKDGAKEIPQEFSPERDLIVHRKKTEGLKNKESFGIKINNFNLKSNKRDSDIALPKQASEIQVYPSKQEVKVTDFIADQYYVTGMSTMKEHLEEFKLTEDILNLTHKSVESIAQRSQNNDDNASSVVSKGKPII